MGTIATHYTLTWSDRQDNGGCYIIHSAKGWILSHTRHSKFFTFYYPWSHAWLMLTRKRSLNSKSWLPVLPIYFCSKTLLQKRPQNLMRSITVYPVPFHNNAHWTVQTQISPTIMMHWSVDYLGEGTKSLLSSLDGNYNKFSDNINW